MTRIEKSIEINTPPEKAWPKFKWDTLPEWQPEFKTIEWTSKDKDKVGSTLHLTGELAGTKTEFDLELTEMIENEKMAYRTTRGNLTAAGFVTLQPTKAGTKVTMMIDYELPYSVLGKLIDKLRVHKALDKSYDNALKKLKDVLEKENV